MAKTMPGFLVGSWGRSDEYTPAQVDRAIKDTNCNAEYSDHAYAMFCSEETFSEISDGNYQELSTELGGMFFDGNNNYNFIDFADSPLEANFGSGSDGGFGSADGGGDGD